MNKMNKMSKKTQKSTASRGAAGSKTIKQRKANKSKKKTQKPTASCGASGLNVRSNKKSPTRIAGGRKAWKTTVTRLNKYADSSSEYNHGLDVIANQFCSLRKVTADAEDKWKTAESKVRQAQENVTHCRQAVERDEKSAAEAENKHNGLTAELQLAAQDMEEKTARAKRSREALELHQAEVEVLTPHLASEEKACSELGACERDLVVKFYRMINKLPLACRGSLEKRARVNALTSATSLSQGGA